MQPTDAHIALSVSDLVAYFCIGLGVASFLVFALLAFLEILGVGAGKRAEAVKQLAPLVQTAVKPNLSADDLGNLMKAAATLGETLVKLGPALSALLGSVLFLAIAAVSSGSFKPADQNQSASPNHAGDPGDPNKGAAPTPDPKKQ